MSIFKAYDIRGRYGDELSVDLAYKIGRSLPFLLGGNRALIGHDARTSSPALCEALSRGLAEAGCNVDVMGLSSTPMVYYFTAKLNYDFSVQITASHNPAADNGFKISRAAARPVGYDTGLFELEKMVKAELHAKALAEGVVKRVDYRDDFLSFLKCWMPDLSGLKMAIDCSDGMAALTVRDIFGKNQTYVADTPDGNFPHHPPNPLESSGRALISATVREISADVGVIYDGDADRVMFVDENGDFVRPDLMTAVMADFFLRTNPGATILQDIRTSRGVTEHLTAAGAVPAMWKVGHAFAKVKLRELGAIFGGELAGHYYFKDFFWCDSGELASLIALGEIAAAKRRGQTFSQLIAPIARYANTGELNYRVNEKDAAMELVKDSIVAECVPDAILDFDGYRIEYKDWWFSIRKSNTEPFLRLIIEASDFGLLENRRAKIEALLKPFIS